MAELGEPADGAELWCAGMRFAGRRTLIAEERAALERCARRALERWIMVALALPALLALPFLVAVGLGSRFGETLGMALGIATIVAWIGGVPALLMTAHDQWRSRARLLRDCRQGEVQVFEGRPDPEAGCDPKLVRLLRAGIKGGGEASQQRLEVLPESRAAVVFGATGPPTLVPVTLVEVAAAPAYALRLPIPAEWRGTEPAPGREFLRRALNQAERSEIETMIRRLRRPHVGSLVVTVFAALSSVSLLTGSHGRARDGEGAAGLIFMMAAGGYILFMYARSVRIARRLKRDAEAGIVITARPEHVPEPAIRSPADDESAATIEFLPFSQLIWNRDGRPASWRQLRRAA